MSTQAPIASSSPKSPGFVTVFVSVPTSVRSKSVHRYAAVRHPDYITAAVNSIVFTQTLAAGVALATPTVTTMTIGGPNCVATSNAQTCSAVLSAPLGSDQWTVDTYASTDGSGTPLSVGVLPYTVIGGTANRASLTLDPAVNSVAFVPATGTCNATPACTIPVTLEALDATGAVIIGASPFVSTTGDALTIDLSGGALLTAETSAGAAAATSMIDANAITLSKAVYAGNSTGIKSLTATAGPLSASFALTLIRHLFVSNTGNGASGSVTSYINGSASAPTISGLHGAAGVAVDSAGNIYVANAYGPTVQIYTSTGAVSPIAGGTVSSGLTDPLGVAVDGAGNIYVADGLSNRVNIYSNSTEYGGAINTSIAGGAITGLNEPAGVAVDSAGDIYVVNDDVVNNGGNVQIYTSKGAASTIAGGMITGLTDPEGVAVDSAGNIYVANSGANNVRIYTNSPTDGGVASPIAGGTITMPAMSGPIGVAVDSAGNIYVANFGANNVRIYTNSTTAGGVASPIAGGTISGLSLPFGVAVY